MHVEELKQELKALLGEQIIFNKEFDFYAKEIKNLSINLLDWCQKIIEKEVKPASAKKLVDGLVFIKKIGGSNRCFIIKIKNGEFREIHLADHDYYNKKMKELGLKKSSQTY